MDRCPIFQFFPFHESVSILQRDFVLCAFVVSLKLKTLLYKIDMDTCYVLYGFPHVSETKNEKKIYVVCNFFLIRQLIVTFSAELMGNVLSQ